MSYHKEAIIIPNQTVVVLGNLSKGKKHRINPIELSDGRHVVSADVLTEKEGIFDYIFLELDLAQYERIPWQEALNLLPQPEDPDEI